MDYVSMHTYPGATGAAQKIEAAGAQINCPHSADWAPLGCVCLKAFPRDLSQLCRPRFEVPGCTFSPTLCRWPAPLCLCPITIPFPAAALLSASCATQLPDTSPCSKLWQRSTAALLGQRAGGLLLWQWQGGHPESIWSVFFLIFLGS